MFRFEKATAVPMKREGKSPRPLVIAPIRSRIVQRAILNVLQDEKLVPDLQPFFRVDSSFGGLEGRSVRDAIKTAHELIAHGYVYFVRSDIAGFFTRIPKSTVLATIADAVRDDEVMELVESAMTVELENLDSLGDERKLFPLEDAGVPQGCCLSPLFGNVLLSDFDREFNQRNVACLRYIDDFLILAKSAEARTKAFRAARRALCAFEMDAYDPTAHSDKAEIGHIADGIHFLGCDIRRNTIAPGKKSRDKLLASVRGLLDESLGHRTNPDAVRRAKKGVVQTLSDVNKRIAAWGDQYSFCNDRIGLRHMDDTIQAMLENYVNTYLREMHATVATTVGGARGDARPYRRLLGVQNLYDSKLDPIIWTESELRTLREHWGKLTLPKLVRLLNRPEASIAAKAATLGLQPSSR